MKIKKNIVVVVSNHGIEHSVITARNLKSVLLVLIQAFRPRSLVEHNSPKNIHARAPGRLSKLMSLTSCLGCDMCIYIHIMYTYIVLYSILQPLQMVLMQILEITNMLMSKQDYLYKKKAEGFSRTSDSLGEKHIVRIGRGHTESSVFLQNSLSEAVASSFWLLLCVEKQNKTTTVHTFCRSRACLQCGAISTSHSESPCYRHNWVEWFSDPWGVLWVVQQTLVQSFHHFLKRWLLRNSYNSAYFSPEIFFSSKIWLLANFLLCGLCFCCFM